MDRFSSDIRDDLLRQLRKKMQELNAIEDMKQFVNECLVILDKISGA